VLRPDGELVIMVYAKWSLNYVLSTALIRRAALLASFPVARAGLLKSVHAYPVVAGLSAAWGNHQPRIAQS
jgi:hypothetical protein